MRKSILLATALTVLAGACGVATAQGAPDAARHQGPGHHGRGGMIMQADANHDGVLTRQEFDAGNAAMFARLDTNHDSFLTRDEHGRIGFYGGGRGHFGGFMLARADANHDGNVSRDEFLAGPLERFNRLDTNHDGVIEASEMPQRHAHADGGRGDDDGKRGPRPDADANHDGRISQAEFAAMGDRMFDRMDANHDGRITQDEIAAMRHHHDGDDSANH